MMSRGADLEGRNSRRNSRGDRRVGLFLPNDSPLLLPALVVFAGVAAVHYYGGFVLVSSIIAAIGAGAFFFLAGSVGLLRFPDAYTRLHALTKADNLGLALVVIGLLPQMDSVLAALKLVVVWLLVLLSGAAVSQLIARAARRREQQS